MFPSRTFATAALLAIPGPLMCEGLSAQGLVGRGPGGAVGGVVVDQESGDPIADVQLVLAPKGEEDPLERVTISNGDGRFRFGEVRHGAYELRASRLGYQTRSDSVTVGPGTFLDVTVSLGQAAIELDEIEVSVGSVVLEGHGFYDRKRQGFRGTFIERSDIEEEQPASVTELFQNVRGLTVVWGGVYGAQIFMNQRSSFNTNMPGCRPEIWLDGIRSTIESLDFMRVETLEGIEIYRGGAPGRFNDSCGTIAVWTRNVIR